MISNTFLSDLEKYESLISFPNAIKEDCISKIKSFKDENLYGDAKLHKSKIIKSLSQSYGDNDSEYFKTIYNYLCVLAVSTFSAELEELFKQAFEKHEIKFDREDVKINLKDILSLSNEFNFISLANLVCRNDSSVNFQNLDSIKNSFSKYFNKEAIINLEVLVQVNYYLHCRHIIVHSGAKINDKFLKNIRKKDDNFKLDLKDGQTLQLKKEDWEEIKNKFSDFYKAYFDLVLK